MYEVIVGNVATVYKGDEFHIAGLWFDLHVIRSKRGTGDDVVMSLGGEPVREHKGWLVV